MSSWLFYTNCQMHDQKNSAAQCFLQYKEQQSFMFQIPYEVTSLLAKKE